MAQDKYSWVPASTRTSPKPGEGLCPGRHHSTPRMRPPGFCSRCKTVPLSPRSSRIRVGSLSGKVVGAGSTSPLAGVLLLSRLKWTSGPLGTQFPQPLLQAPFVCGLGPRPSAGLGDRYQACLSPPRRENLNAHPQIHINIPNQAGRTTNSTATPKLQVLGQDPPHLRVCMHGPPCSGGWGLLTGPVETTEYRQSEMGYRTLWSPGFTPGSLWSLLIPRSLKRSLRTWV